jgi:small subunit ribosomal protein S16
MKKHLLGGVAKGAFSESDAEARYNKWAEEKGAKGAARVSKLAGDARAAEKARNAAETKAKEEKAKAIAAKKAEAAGAVAEEAAAEAAEESIEVAAETTGEEEAAQ